MITRKSKLGILTLGIIAAILIFLNSREDDNFGGVGFFLLILFLGALTFLIILISDIIRLRATKSIQSFIPTFTASLIISASIYILNHMNQPSNKPILIQAGYSPGVAASSIVLRIDNSYEFFNGAFLSSQTEHGTYTIKDSFIFLNGRNVDKTLISNRLLITTSKIIYQVDSNGKKIENSIPFIIHIDNRNQ